MNFTPDTDQAEQIIPLLDDAKKEDGWQGHTTNESIESLRAQISTEIGRLGGTVTRWMPGTFDINGKQRPGVQIEWQIVGPNGDLFTGRIDVAGLPWKEPYNGNRSHGKYKASTETRRHQSLAMALYNVREALRSMRILQVLSPGYAALIPWMLSPGTNQTLGEMWGMGSKALPAPTQDGSVVEGSFTVEE